MAQVICDSESKENNNQKSAIVGKPIWNIKKEGKIREKNENLHITVNNKSIVCTVDKRASILSTINNYSGKEADLLRGPNIVFQWVGVLNFT